MTVTDLEYADLVRRLQAVEKDLATLRRRNIKRHHIHHPVVECQVRGIVKWFNVKDGYGFITRCDTGEDVFIHKRGIGMNNPNKCKPSVGDGEMVVFDVIFISGRTAEAVNVTGPNGLPVIGSRFAPDRRHQSAPCIHSTEPSSVEPSLVATNDGEEPHPHVEINRDINCSGSASDHGGDNNSSDSDDHDDCDNIIICADNSSDLEHPISSDDDCDNIQTDNIPSSSIPSSSIWNSIASLFSHATHQRHSPWTHPPDIPPDVYDV